MDDIKAKQQIVEKIKDSANILVTVSNDPSVDALSAALGLTLTLDKLDKHTTAIFSGTVPPAITFLEPEKTFDNTVDSLRDFIIALDKSKADHLRYKVDGDMVKIFITPFKTTLSSDDLEFSQGDYNAELVIALGVDNQEHLDKALEAHGQILHDATIVTITAGEQISTLGGIDWHDSQASSMSEMIAGLVEALKSDKKPLLDQQVATALLTGVVAETDRFSNTRTTSRTMTVASQLIDAGGDQQLIAAKLDGAHESRLGDSTPTDTTSDDSDPDSGNSLSIDHGSSPEGETLAEMDKRVRGADSDKPAASDKIKPAPSAPADDATITSAYALGPEDEPAADSDSGTTSPSESPSEAGRSYMTSTPAYNAPISATSDTTATSGQGGGSYIISPPHETPGSEAVADLGPAPGDSVSSAYAPEPAPSSDLLPPPPVITPPVVPPTPGPSDLGLPMPPPVPDFSGGPSPLTSPSDTPPERLGDILAPEPAPSSDLLPPSPVLTPSTPPLTPLINSPLPPPPTGLSPLPPVPPADPVAPPAPQPPAPSSSVSFDPGQFRIPGQPQ